MTISHTTFPSRPLPCTPRQGGWVSQPLSVAVREIHERTRKEELHSLQSRDSGGFTKGAGTATKGTRRRLANRGRTSLGEGIQVQGLRRRPAIHQSRRADRRGTGT